MSLGISEMSLDSPESCDLGKDNLGTRQFAAVRLLLLSA